MSSAESVSSDSLVTNVSMTQLVESERYLEDRARLEDVLHTDPSVINVGDEEGLTALHLACSQGRDKLVRIIGGNSQSGVFIDVFTLQWAVRLKWM